MKLKQLFCGILAAGISTLAQPQSNLTGSWLVTVIGEASTRTLIISSEAPTADGALLQAKYGMSDKGQTPISAEMRKVDGKRQLALTTQANTKIDVTEQSDGQFKGTFTLKNGTTKDVVIARIGDGELLATAKPTTVSALQKPGPDVPPNCAIFSGGWGGEWPVNGWSYLWVTSVSADCTAKVVYNKTAVPPKATVPTTTATIKGDILSLPRPDGGTTTFEFRDGTVSAFYHGPSGTNNTTMQRLDLSSAAQQRIDDEQKAALAAIPPSADIPAACAAYYGNWVGSWSQGGFAEQYFRVVEVRNSSEGCLVRYSYSGSKSPIPAKETATLRNGTISFVCNRSTGGTCIFTRQGEILTASYTNPGGGNNNGTFKRVQ
ncbi:MAG: hypothetical protein WAT81_04630 [Candidatus Moraniibacteriota bacterium]